MPFLPLPHRGDATFAAALVVAAVAELALVDEVAPKGVATLALLLGAVALGWRRRAPLAVSALVAGALLLGSVYGVPIDASIVMLVAVVVATYSVAAHAETRAAVAGLVLALLGIAVSVHADDAEIGNFLFGAFWATCAWTVGVVGRARASETASLAERAARLEREREERVRAAAAQERARIARELHDVISHSVSVMVVQAGAGEQVLDADPERAREALRTVQATGREALGELAHLLGVLRGHTEDTGVTAPQPGLAQLEALVEQARSAGTQVDVRIEGRPRELPRGMELSLFRILQEALTNVRKHAGPVPTSVRLDFAEEEVRAEVRDHGEARSGRDDGGHGGGGHGLVGMRERAALYGGSLEARPVPDGGFVVRVRLPLEPA